MEPLTHNGIEFYIEENWTKELRPTITLFKEDKTFKLTKLGFFDPRLHKEFGFTTFNSVLKWWASNRGKIRYHDLDSYYEAKSRLFDYFYPFNIYLEDSLTSMKECLAGSLNAPSLTIRFRDRDSVGSQGFHLVQSENMEETANNIVVYRPHTIREGVMTLTSGEAVSQGSSISTEWTQLKNYTYKMCPETHSFFRSVRNEQNYFFGLELELSTKLSPLEIQTIVVEMEPRQKPFFIFKSDSTISGKYPNFLEVVTVPCSPRYLRKNFKIFFQKIEKLCKNKGKAISDFFDTGTNLSNGIHIHVGRNDFCSKQHSKRYITAWNQWDEKAETLFQEISQRPTKYAEGRWCKINSYYTKTKPKSKFKLAKFARASSQRSLAIRLKGVSGSGKYTIINEDHPETLETRIYQGIFDLSHIMRCISFNEAMLDFTSIASYKDFDENFVRSFHEFIKGQTKYKSIEKITEKLVA